MPAVQQINIMYPFAYVLIIIGIIVYNFAPTQQEGQDTSSNDTAHWRTADSYKKGIKMHPLHK